jgi:vacuolar-type H+-ATPase subunit E/Vma4
MIRKGDFKLSPAFPVGLFTKSAHAEYDKFMESARAEYDKIVKSATAEYNKIEESARAEYNKIKKSTFWNLYKNPNNRIEIWR